MTFIFANRQSRPLIKVKFYFNSKNVQQKIVSSDNSESNCDWKFIRLYVRVG